MIRISMLTQLQKDGKLLANSDKVIGRSEVELLIRPDSPAKSQISSKIGRLSYHSKEGCGSVVGNAAKWAAEIILREGIPKDI